jgi:hypothetical protein
MPLALPPLLTNSWPPRTTVVAIAVPPLADALLGRHYADRRADPPCRSTGSISKEPSWKS